MGLLGVLVALRARRWARPPGDVAVPPAREGGGGCGRGCPRAASLRRPSLGCPSKPSMGARLGSACPGRWRAGRRRPCHRAIARLGGSAARRATCPRRAGTSGPRTALRAASRRGLGAAGSPGNSPQRRVVEHPGGPLPPRADALAPQAPPAAAPGRASASPNSLLRGDASPRSARPRINGGRCLTPDRADRLSHVHPPRHHHVHPPPLHHDLLRSVPPPRRGSTSLPAADADIASKPPRKGVRQRWMPPSTASSVGDSSGGGGRGEAS